MGKKNKKNNLENIYKKEEIIENNLFFLILEKIILFSLFFALITPLIISREMFFPFVSPKGIYFMFFAQIIFFSWLILVIHSKKYLPSKNIILFAFILYLITFFLSSIFGVNFYESFWSVHERMTGLLMHLHLFGFFIAISSTIKKKDWKIIFCFNSIIASIIALIAIYDRYVGIEKIDFRGGSTLGNTSFMGTYLLLSSFIAFYLFIKNKDIYKYAGFVNFIIISLGIFLNTGGRAALISFVGGMFLIFLLWLFFEKKGIFRVVSGIIIFILIAIALFGFSIVLNPEGDNSKFILEKLDLGTIGGRTIVWDISLKGFLDKPIFGWGPENFSFAFAKYYNPCLGTDFCGADTLYDRAHNFWYDNLISFGIVGSLAYIFLFFSVIFFLWKNYFKKNIGFEEMGVFTALFLAYFIQGLTVFDVISSYMLIFLIFAFISSLNKKEEKDTKAKEANFLIIFLVFIVFSFYINYFIIKPYNASVYTLEAIKTQDEKFETKEKILNNSIYSSLLGRGHIRRQLASQVLFNEKVNINLLKEIEFFIEELSREIENSPNDYNNYLDLGRLYNHYVNVFVSINKNITEEEMEEVMTYVEKAENVFEKALEISPNKQSTYWFLAETKVKLKKFDEAVSLLERSVELEPQILNSHIYLIRVIKDVLKDEDLAKQKVEEALEINSSWDFSYMFL